jgi:hypothetical protein
MVTIFEEDEKKRDYRGSKSMRGTNLSHNIPTSQNTKNMPIIVKEQRVDGSYTKQGGSVGKELVLRCTSCVLTVFFLRVFGSFTWPFTVSLKDFVKNYRATTLSKHQVQ